RTNPARGISMEFTQLSTPLNGWCNIAESCQSKVPICRQGSMLDTIGRHAERPTTPLHRACTEGAHETEMSDPYRRDYGGAHLQFLWSARREARQAEFPHLLRSQGAGRVRAWRRDDPFVLVSDRAPNVRRST